MMFLASLLPTLIVLTFFASKWGMLTFEVGTVYLSLAVILDIAALWITQGWNVDTNVKSLREPRLGRVFINAAYVMFFVGLLNLCSSVPSSRAYLRVGTAVVSSFF